MVETRRAFDRVGLRRLDLFVEQVGSYPQTRPDLTRSHYWARLEIVQIGGVPHDSRLTSHLSLKLSERNRLHDSTVTDLMMYKAPMNLHS